MKSINSVISKIVNTVRYVLFSDLKFGKTYFIVSALNGEKHKKQVAKYLCKSDEYLTFETGPFNLIGLPIQQYNLKKDCYGTSGFIFANEDEADDYLEYQLCKSTLNPA